MIDRRTLFSATTAFASGLAALFGTRSAEAHTRELPGVPDIPLNVPGTRAPRGRIGREERLPTLDLESRQDFLMSVRSFINTDMGRTARARADAILEANGIPKDNPDFPHLDAVRLFKDDPAIAGAACAWLAVQQLSWAGLREEYEGNLEVYLKELEAADKAGPGTLELNPDLDMPDYTRTEIHIMPGGYVGSPVAGYLYHYGTNGFYTGRNEQEQIHLTSAFGLPLPADGKVRRVLDVGTGIGQHAMALKERFPDAEVWGIDVGGPMVRYAHLRAVERGLDVNFAQRLGEDTKFPDGYFDLVTSYIMMHEVSPEGTAGIVREAYRITRPGGVFYPVDFNLRSTFLDHPYSKYRQWWDHRWNCEPWSIRFRENDLPGLIRQAGFTLNEEGPVALPRFGVLNATRPA